MKFILSLATVALLGASGLVAKDDKPAANPTTNTVKETTHTKKEECTKDGKHLDVKSSAECRTQGGTWSAEDSTKSTAKPAK